MSNRRKTTARKAAPRKRRRMAAMPATLTGRRRSTRRRMSGKKNNLQETAVDILQVGGGMIVGALVPMGIRKLAPNSTMSPHVINLVTVGVGVGVGMALPNLRKVGVGMAAGAVANSVAIAIPQIGAMTGHTRRVRPLAPAERTALLESVKTATERMRGQLPETLTGGKTWNGEASYG